MLKNKIARAGEARATDGAKTRRGQASAVFTRHFTTRDALRQLAVRAAQSARRCERETTKRKFERLARFLETCARGGLR